MLYITHQFMSMHVLLFPRTSQEDKQQRITRCLGESRTKKSSHDNRSSKIAIGPIRFLPKEPRPSNPLSSWQVFPSTTDGGHRPNSRSYLPPFWLLQSSSGFFPYPGLANVCSPTYDQALRKVPLPAIAARGIQQRIPVEPAATSLNFRNALLPIIRVIGSSVISSRYAAKGATAVSWKYY